LIGRATSLLGDLEYRKQGLQRQVENVTTNASEISDKVIENNAELAASDTIINAFPAGPKKEKAITERLKQQATQRELSEKAASINPEAILEMELQAMQVTARITVVATFIGEVETTKNTLPE